MIRNIGEDQQGLGKGQDVKEEKLGRSQQEKVKSDSTSSPPRCPKLVGIFGAMTSSVGMLGRVSCWSPLGVPPGVVHAPNLYFISSYCHIRGFFLHHIHHETISSFIGF
jgi:hypothetical protein